MLSMSPENPRQFHEDKCALGARIKHMLAEPKIVVVVMIVHNNLSSSPREKNKTKNDSIASRVLLLCYSFGPESVLLIAPSHLHAV